MAFFEKLSAMAKNATDKATVLARDAADKAGELAKVASEKANVAIEVGKLNNQIRTENNNIAVAKNQMGQWIWEQFSAGEAQDPVLQELCGKIVAANCAIEALNAQVAALKMKETEVQDAPFEAAPVEDVPEEAPQAEAAQPAEAQPEEPETPDQQ